MLLTRALTVACAAPCLEEAFGRPLNCTSDDVQVEFITVDEVTRNCEFPFGVPGDTLAFDGTIYVEVSAGNRFDIGFYFGLASATDDSCTLSIVPPGIGADLDGDMCGDFGVPHLYRVPVSGLVVPCQDTDGDGFLDINLCSAWSTSGTEVCSVPSDALPSSKFACSCGGSAQSKLDIVVPPVTKSGEEFGRSVSLTDDLLVVGAPSSTNNVTERVHLFEDLPVISGYREVTQFQDPDDPSGNLEFGASVGIDGETVVVGAPNDGGGSVSIFVRDGLSWKLQQKLNDVGGSCTRLGQAVAISGNTIVAGAPGGDCALVFHRNGETWAVADELGAGPANARFGTSVDVSGDRLIVGAPGVEASQGSCSSAGAAYVFRNDAGDWILEDTIEDPVGSASCFGASVAINQMTAVVGAPFDDGAASNAGTVYEVERSENAWSIVGELIPSPAPVAGARFGGVLDMSPDSVIVGSPGVAAYSFRRSRSVVTPAAPSAGGATRALTEDVWEFCDRYDFPQCDPRSFTQEHCDPATILFGSTVGTSSKRLFTGAPKQESAGAEDAGRLYYDDAPPCGNRRSECGEDCDDGNTLWQPGELCNASCAFLACGDTDDSGAITSSDALFALRVAIGSKSCAKQVCDVTRDGSVAASDALGILKCAVGGGSLTCS